MKPLAIPGLFLGFALAAQPVPKVTFHVSTPEPPSSGIRDAGGIRDSDTLAWAVNGKIVGQHHASQLKPEKIDSIRILKKRNARRKYGRKGRNGAVEIFLKP